MIGRLNHIGVATPSIDESVKMYRELLGATSVTDKAPELAKRWKHAFFLLGTGGEVSRLIPLYAIGVFTSFTLSQAGMTRHHIRLKEDGWREQGLLAVSVDDRRLNWPEREFIRQIGENCTASVSQNLERLIR